MGRLIDADALLVQVRQIDFLKTPNSTKLSACEIMKIINNQPTAYDVEKVVAWLEDIREKANGCFGIMCSECKYTQKCHEGEMDYKVAIDKAIDIVKRGVQE